MKNSPANANDDLKRHHVVYQYNCQVRGCPHFYIGMTTMRASKRISCHVQEGAIHLHHVRHHGSRPSRDQIIEGFKILEQCQDPNRLRILEALYILQLKPTLNTTNEVLILPTLAQRFGIGAIINEDPAINPINENTINDFITALRNETTNQENIQPPQIHQEASNNTRNTSRYNLRPRR